MTPQSDSLRILIVEDERSFLLSTKMYMTQLGHSVEGCTTGEEAIKLLEGGEPYDMVFLDYKLPGISGLNVFQWMHEQKMNIPVVVMTGEGSENIAVEFMKLGAYDYIRKELYDRQHLPILINGVHDRFMFQREKEERQKNEKGKKNNVLIVEMFSKAVNSLAHILNNTLSVVMMNINEQSQDLLPAVREVEQERFKKACSDMNRQYALVADGVKSLLILTEAYRSGVVQGAETGELEKILRTNINALKNEFEKVQRDDVSGS